MATSVLVLGESGTGKSSSLRTLDPAKTFVINILDKPLPFLGWRKKYTPLSEDGMAGNYYTTDDHSKVMRLLRVINDKRTDIENVVIDDWQYLLANAFMRRATEKGYDKFSELGKNAWEVIHYAVNMNSRLKVMVLAHSDTDTQGKVRIKTIGKMLDEKVSLEGMFTIVLHALVQDGKFIFLTQNDGIHLAKSPMGMLDAKIDNDLSQVVEKINQYELA